LWTVGLLAATSLVSVAVLHPGAPGPIRLAHGTMMLILALICMVAGLSQVRSGLVPLNQLRSRLSAVRSGRERKVDGNYPGEVQPLVDDLNALLEHRERVVARALAKAGDLAHGLKTPLAVLSQEAERADAAGHPELAVTIYQQVERMRRHVDYHLAQARAVASGAAPGARCPVVESADGLARTLRRLYEGRGIDMRVTVPQEHAFRGQREDLDEMLGNLLDNACKWATSRIVVESSLEGSEVVITVDDDGPGLDPRMREAVLQRGVRADEAAPGSGFGLAIVRDLAELYGGSVSLSASRAGGVRATLRLPAC
jgi:signal transduction histidine kinase